MKKVTRVFWISLVIVAIAVIAGIVAPEGFEAFTGNIESFISTTFGWYYLLLVTAIVILSLFFAISPIGTIKLGKPDDKPDYSLITWFAMLFSAGMGIGLVFFGAAEPLSHFVLPATAEPETAEAFKDAMKYTFFHWGIHAWAVYGIVALGLAYFKFRKGAPGLISATLTPIFGERLMRGALGTIIDVLSVFATVVGVATTLGFGASQINGGLTYLFGIPTNFKVQLIIILIVTVLFIISAWSGIGKGIKYLSNTNIYLAVILLVLMFIVGPTLLILNIFTDSFGAYIQDLVHMSFRSAPLGGAKREWIDEWTIFYWAWWISWSPFVGMFIARVSKGRTIREFLSGVLLLPAVVSFIWFSAFGSAAIKVQESGAIDLSKFATEQVLFATFSEFPWSMALSLVALLLIITFFITSADSATFVLGMQTTNGSLVPSNSVKITWGIAQSAVAVILLYSGGLQALQNMLVASAFPFSIIIILMMISLFKTLTKEQKALGLYHRPNNEKKDK